MTNHSLDIFRSTGISQLGSALGVALLAALIAAGTSPARATETDLEVVEEAASNEAGPVSDEAAAAARKREREAELEEIRRSLGVSERRQGTLAEEIKGLEKDRAKLSTDLIATAEKLRGLDNEIQAMEAKLDELYANEDGIRESLLRRKDVIAEVLMALQRMGRTPPPALLSRPEDALGAIRSSILAGAVLPDLRVEAEALAADLTELTRLRAAVQAQRDDLKGRYTLAGEARARLDILMAAKQDQQDQTTIELRAEQTKAGRLAAKAKSLKELIGSLEKDIKAAARAAEQAKAVALLVPPANRAEAEDRMEDSSRIAPAVNFGDTKGLLRYPVAGRMLSVFGDPDGLGGSAQGISLAASPGSTVTSPADGWVVFAGPFRSYGQVLIVNAGDGYHLVMAGMERIDAAIGQFVLAGEPVARMGATRLASLGTIEHTSAQPVLYVEFRKEGAAINSAPWWTGQPDGEVNG